jgi:hypothetical protein
MNYKIIQDEQLLLDFIQWLPDLKDNEKYYCCLFARKKYYQDLIKSNDKTQLKRFLADKKTLLNKIKQLEIVEGCWKLGDVSAPQESLVLYIMPNPRCMKKATIMMGKRCWDLLGNYNYNILAESLSCVQKSKARTCYVHFDIDSKNVDLNKLNDILPDGSYKILETRGGYHLLVDPNLPTYNVDGRHNKEFWSNWYKNITNAFTVDQAGDQMMPVPGTTQGGFIPKFIN